MKNGRIIVVEKPIEKVALDGVCGRCKTKISLIYPKHGETPEDALYNAKNGKHQYMCEKCLDFVGSSVI